MSKSSGREMRSLLDRICAFCAPKNEGGFTLVEVILVMVFISIALVTLLNAFNVGIRSSVGSEFINVSTQLAEDKMEQIKSDKSSFGYDYLIETNYPEEENAGGFSGYTQTVSITDYSTYKEVSVTVSHSATPSVSIVTLFTNY